MFDKLKTRFDADDRAVSPVIGVILMVAITVILAAVIASMTLGLGENVGQTAPTASIDGADAADAYTSDNAELFVLSHNSGKALKYDNMKVVIRDAGTNQVQYTFDQGFPAASNLQLNKNGVAFTSGEFTVGDSLTIVESATGVDPVSAGDYKVEIIHKPSDSTVSSSTITLA